MEVSHDGTEELPITHPRMMHLLSKLGFPKSCLSFPAPQKSNTTTGPPITSVGLKTALSTPLQPITWLPFPPPGGAYQTFLAIPIQGMTFLHYTCCFHGSQRLISSPGPETEGGEEAIPSRPPPSLRLPLTHLRYCFIRHYDRLSAPGAKGNNRLSAKVDFLSAYLTAAAAPLSPSIRTCCLCYRYSAPGTPSEKGTGWPRLLLESEPPTLSATPPHLPT